MRVCLFSLGVLWSCGLPLLAQEQPPRSRDPRIKIELFAEHPQIVTPTGIDVDHAGRVWAIESNTHFRPKEYKGHPTDRLLVMSDANADGRADRIITFADGFTHAMSVVVRPAWFTDPIIPQPKPKPGQSATPSAVSIDKNKSTAPLSVFLATRAAVFVLNDDDGDLKADRRKLIVRLESKGVYPHNALAGFALHPLGWLYFGMGENLGADYKIIGSDGTTLSGGGEGGNIYRCRPDGSKLQKIATGFWNPHANCFDAFGRLFSVDNDPDSRPPCRLLHIIPGGDYGYRFRNGRRGLHPFSSWNGEIPGTLPMVAGTGEAPSGIVAYESDGLPEEYIGNLLVTSWGDHRIDRFRLKPQGTSFTSLAEPVIVGGENFRPVGLACAPDGSLYCTDWMLRDYNLHGHGRIWKISPVKAREERVVDVSQIHRQPIDQFSTLLNSKRLDVRRAFTDDLVKMPDMRQFLSKYFEDHSNPTKMRIEAFWSLLRHANIDVDNRQIPWRGESELSAAATAYAWAVDEPWFEGWTKPAHNFFGEELEKWETRNATDLNQKGKVEVDNTLPLALIWVAHHQFSLESGNAVASLFRVQEGDPFTFSMVVSLVQKHWGKPGPPQFFDIEQWKDPRSRLGLLLAFRQSQPQNAERLSWFLHDRDPAIRRALLQWIAEERLVKFRPIVVRMLNDPNLTSDMFLASLAALELLDGSPPSAFEKSPPEKYVLPIVQDEKRPASVRALALRLVDPADKALTPRLFESLLSSNEEALKLEALRTLKSRTSVESAKLLLKMATDQQQQLPVRLEAIAGLAPGGQDLDQDEASFNFLVALAFDSQQKLPLRIEALRSLRGFAKVFEANLVRKQRLADSISDMFDIEKLSTAGTRQKLYDQLCLTFPKETAHIPKLMQRRSVPPTDRAGWLKVAHVNEKPDAASPAANSENLGDAAAGQRIFFHPQSAGCFKCHTINGRGGKVGPDLSTIGRTLTREKLLDSILEPSREIAPQFVTWLFETQQGKSYTGMIVQENLGHTILGDADGKLTDLKTIDIENRVPQKTSVMPEKLLDKLTVQEVRDLLAYLESLR